MNVDRIKNTLVELATKHNTVDIFKICELEGIIVRFKNYSTLGMKAYYTRVRDDIIIYINSNYDFKSQQLLCAHELGHIKLHPDCHGNHFTSGSNDKLEYEANLFAAYFMLDENLYGIKFSSMNSYLLNSVMDSNLKIVKTSNKVV